MRWERLFEDIEAQAAQAERVERDAEVADRTEREVGRQQLTDRLRAATGAEITIRVVGVDGPVHGVVRAAGAGWMVISERPGAKTLVVVARVLTMTGLGVRAEIPGSRGAAGARLGLGYALRQIARERVEVRLVLVDGAVVAGVVDRVGADFADIGADGGVQATIPFDAVALVRCTTI
jgi:hypothetical protein